MGFVANDWHAALVPMYLKREQKKGGWPGAKSAVLLHNLVFQGRFPKEAKAAERLHLDEDMVASMSVTQPLKIGQQKKATKGLTGKEEVPNPAMPCLNFMMGAIKACDVALTVSPRYAKEVAETPEKGAELEKLLTMKGITGILNGVEDIVRPDNAELGIKTTYDKTTLEKKSQVKTAMQKSLGFTVDASIPMFVFMGRLDAQKGVDVMFESIDKALKGGLNAQFITMGSGIEELEEVAAELEDKYPGNFKAVLSFKGQEKYRTYAAADFAMMPSRYEPCGLVQMEAMRFGTIPIVAPTGGLTDTVQDGRTGLVMEHECNSEALTDDDVSMMVNNLNRACALAADPMRYRGMQVQAMEASESFTWAAAVKQYEEEFKRMGAYMHK